MEAIKSVYRGLTSLNKGLVVSEKVVASKEETVSEKTVSEEIIPEETITEPLQNKDLLRELVTVGENGETAFKTSGDKNIDLFVSINRNAEVETIVSKFLDAWNENPEYATKVLLNFRDIKGGKGEKNISKIMLFIIKIACPEIYKKLLPLFIEVGCWKDVLFLYEMSIHYGINCNDEIDAFCKQLNDDKTAERPSICAKWAPSEGCHFDKKTKIAKRIMHEMNLTPKNYRFLLKDLRSKINIVESQLSQGVTSQINFSHIPSRAHLIYKNAFSRETNAKGETKHDRSELMQRYRSYLEDLKAGVKKANYKGIMPHELVKKLSESENGEDELIENQWKSIRTDIENLSIFEKCVSIVDVSGSMEGCRRTVSPMDVAIALGILISECSKGVFKDKVFTFDSNPVLSELNGFSTLREKVRYVKKLPWGGSTNMESVFDQIIDQGVKNSLRADQMPERLIILTDMQFNQVCGHDVGTKFFDKMKLKFEKHGYIMPKIICWNLRTINTLISTVEDENVCMISGFSTPILKAFMELEEITPLGVFLNAINLYKLPEIEISLITKESIDVEKLGKVVRKLNFKNSAKSVDPLGTTNESADEPINESANEPPNDTEDVDFYTN